MNTGSVTQAAPASLDSGLADSRLATIAKITRSVSVSSNRRPAATRRIAVPIPSQAHNRSAR